MFRRKEFNKEIWVEGRIGSDCALDHVFSVERGEFVAIIGASGSGKSTLMNMIGGIDYPTSGSIIIDGNEIQAMSEDELAIFRRRNLGIVYQFYNLIPTLTAEENIALPWKLDGRKENNERLSEIVNMLGLEKRAKHLPGQMSGGQQQRVSIGRALINEHLFLQMSRREILIVKQAERFWIF